MIQADESRQPLVVDIKRNSLDDGPGIRTTVFFKGCPLRCVFCHSPETQEVCVEIGFSGSRCIGCGRCAEVCPVDAIDFMLPGRIDRSRCDRCGRCVDACPSGGLRLIGTYYDVERLSEILLRDQSYYRHSGGGVTLSGGECTLHVHYLERLLERLKARGLHVTLETSGHFDYDTLAGKVLPQVDLIYFDVKFIDSGLHRRYTGKTNERILANLRRLLRARNTLVQVRVPLVPGVTATRENLSAIVDFLCEAGAESITCLPYNPMGIGMAEGLGRQKPALPERFMTQEEEDEVRRVLEDIIDAKQRGRPAPGPDDRYPGGAAMG